MPLRRLAVALALAMAGAACSSQTASPPSVDGSQAPTTAATGDPSEPGSVATTEPTSGDASASSSRSEAGQAAGTPSPSTAAPSRAPSGATSSGSDEQAPEPVAPGRYTYTTEGESQVGLAAPRDLPSKTSLEASEADAAGHQLLHRDYRDADGLGTLSTLELSFSGDGVRLHRLDSQTTVRVLGADRTSSASLRANPPALIAPAGFDVGSRTELHLTGGGVTADGTVHVRARDVVTVAGVDVDVFVIDIDVTFSGDSEGEQHATWWVRPSDLLVVREETTIDATSDGVDYRERQTSQLRSLQPA